jgi:hypothetical protein
MVHLKEQLQDIRPEKAKYACWPYSKKKPGLKLSTRDVFVNIAGGLNVADTAIDLSYGSCNNLLIP